MNVFTWSLPFVGEKSKFALIMMRMNLILWQLVTDMLMAVLNTCSKQELLEYGDGEDLPPIDEKGKCIQIERSPGHLIKNVNF